MRVCGEREGVHALRTVRVPPRERERDASEPCGEREGVRVREGERTMFVLPHKIVCARVEAWKGADFVF